MLDSSDNRRSAARRTPAALGTMLRASDGILDMMPIATFICDAKGTILQYNSRAVEARFFDIDGTPLQRSELAEVLATRKPARDFERIVERMDGVRVTVSLNIDPLRNAKGDVIGAVNFFIDITERKRTVHEFGFGTKRTIQLRPAFVVAADIGRNWREMAWSLMTQN